MGDQQERIEAVNCSKCKNPIGFIVTLADGQEWFSAGGGIFRAAHGACAHCGYEFHWSAGDRALSALVKYVLSVRGR